MSHPDTGAAPAANAFSDVLAAIRLHGADLRQIPGVIGVRPGYRFKGGWITSEPAVVVTVMRKLDRSSLASVNLIPRKLGSVVVDVAPATPLQQLEASRRTQLAAGAVSGSVLPHMDMG